MAKTEVDEFHVIANVRVGHADVAPAASAHVRGVHEGNHPRRNDSRRATGIRPKRHARIDPRMPVLSPA